MSRRKITNRYRPGDHYVTCDYTGLKIKRSDAMRTWDNLIVRKDQWEPRHPQDFVRGRIDKITVEEPRSQWNTNNFLTDNEVTGDDL